MATARSRRRSTKWSARLPRNRETAKYNRRMHQVRQDDPPFVGSSHQFVGAEQGGVNFWVDFLNAQPGEGPGRIGIRSTKFSSCAPGVGDGSLTARNSKGARRL